MTLVIVPQSNPNDEVTAISVNQGSNAIAAVVNGQLDDTNISSISGSKIANETITTPNIADKAITSRKAQLTILGADGTTLNPVPTARVDIAGSSVTFTCDVASYLDVTVSAYIQVNANATADVTLSVDGVNVTPNPKLSNSGTTTIQTSVSRRYRRTLTAGSHTIKLTTQSTVVNTAVAHDPSWWGILVAQP